MTKTKKVDFEMLQKDGYLTEKQINNAKKMGLTIKDNKVLNDKS